MRQLGDELQDSARGRPRLLEISARLQQTRYDGGGNAIENEASCGSGDGGQIVCVGAAAASLASASVSLASASPWCFLRRYLRRFDERLASSSAAFRTL